MKKLRNTALDNRELWQLWGREYCDVICVRGR